MDLKPNLLVRFAIIVVLNRQVRGESRKGLAKISPTGHTKG